MPSAFLSLARAILEALTYSDIFDYPLRFDELHRYLPARANADELSAELDSLRGQVEQQDGFYFLADRNEIVDIRKERETRSRKLLPIALRYGRILSSLPFIRMVALTGSLAVMNISTNADFDYMLVTAKGRVWTARAFALLFNRLVRPFGHTICPNLIVSESALEWHLRDLYSARELIQMIPISGVDVYWEVMEVNSWAREIMPNRSHDFSREHKATKAVTTVHRLLESPLRGTFGDKFESWEMTRKIARFSRQPGFGEETIFTAEVCQGNFHHHRKWTSEIFEKRLHVVVSALAAVPGGEVYSVASSPSSAMGVYKV